MIRLISLLFLVLLNLVTLAQNLILSGVITYERRENVHKLYTEENSWTEERLKHMPKYKIDQFTLHFNTQEGLYKLLDEDENPAFIWMKVANGNAVHTDLKSERQKSDKTIYDADYRIEDSIPQYTWKMLGEFREIAGYSCRKAATILFDSIYVIAFYTDQIPVSLGPESFTGLPGMILGLVVPRMNLTWFATKVESQSLPENVFVLKDNKRKKYSYKSFTGEIQKALKDWDDFGAKMVVKARL